MQDEDKKEHLLGLAELWHEIDDEDYYGFEDTDHVGMDFGLRRQMRDAEEAQGIMDTTDPNSIQEAMQSIEDMKNERKQQRDNIFGISDNDNDHDEEPDD